MGQGISQAVISLAVESLLSRLPIVDVPRLIPKPTKNGFAISFDGTKIYWEILGPPETRLPPLVFCYGLVCSMNQWRAQIERYSPTRTCLLLDYRGHHRSDAPADPQLLNLSALGKDVVACLDAAGITEPVHIFGHSMGCNVALEVALAEPKRVASLILLCGTGRNPFASMFRSNLLDQFIKPILREYQNNKSLYHLIWRLALLKPQMTATIASFAGFNDQASQKRDMLAYASAVAAVEADVFFPLLTEMATGSSAAILGKIRTASLVVAGSADLVTPPNEQKHMADHLPDSEYLEVPAGSHNVQLDFGEFVGLKVEDFWKRRGLC